ncbi:MAG: glucosaminidase domain-containing protein [Nocardiopsaceae bacterium]|nr:glucosaminidase domain-containing protein [Nocardiopsaceae bacterium]
MSAKSAAKPWWQQATALVTVSTGGAVTGLTFAPGTAAAMTSPTGMPPVHLMALDKAANAGSGAGTPGTRSADEQLRSAVVNVAKYYLRLAQTRTPDQVNALIWGADSTDGADHGQSCAAFASLVLELGAQAVGRESWVYGGGSYPWPVHSWVDARVEENPDSPEITSVVQDAEAHGRWRPLGGGYQPRPGDWVVFDQHVEVVTGYSGGALDTIGADSLPGYTINAHTFGGSLAAHGVAGFVDNGHLASPGEPASPGQKTPAPRAPKPQAPKPQVTAKPAPAAEAAIPGSVAQQPLARAVRPAPAPKPSSSETSAAIPGLVSTPAATGRAAPAAKSPASAAKSSVPAAKSQREFIASVVPGAIAAQRRYGVPASVTIAQAISESDWGTSELAVRDHNLFGIKGTGPAGATAYPTREFSDGHWETVHADFRSYHNIAESISDHAELLATSGHYTRAMADRAVPDAFASDLTGVYATDPGYGSNLIALMRLYNLYRYDATTAGSARRPANGDNQPASGSGSARGRGRGQAAGTRIPGLMAARRAYDAERYRTPLPAATTAAYFATARLPIGRAEQLYRDVAGRAGISWKLLAACDWMQCQSDPRFSPVHGERLGAANRDGSVYATRSAALARCAADLIELADAVYRIDLTVPRPMSIRSLAEVFAAFRWGGLLDAHGVSAMEFPYSVAGLTAAHARMHWPAIDSKTVPDRPGSKFKPPFGAVPVVLGLRYPATV